MQASTSTSETYFAQWEGWSALCLFGFYSIKLFFWRNPIRFMQWSCSLLSIRPHQRLATVSFWSHIQWTRMHQLNNIVSSESIWQRCPRKSLSLTTQMLCKQSPLAFNLSSALPVTKPSLGQTNKPWSQPKHWALAFMIWKEDTDVDQQLHTVSAFDSILFSASERSFQKHPKMSVSVDVTGRQSWQLPLAFWVCSVLSKQS